MLRILTTQKKKENEVARKHLIIWGVIGFLSIMAGKVFSKGRGSSQFWVVVGTLGETFNQPDLDLLCSY